MTIFCTDINDALAKANQLKSSGSALYFRGQKATWSLTTTCQRKGTKDFESKTLPFLDWLAGHPTTAKLSEMQWLSIAQHYGFVTPLLDISTSPRVAANFAALPEPLDATTIDVLTPELKVHCELSSDITSLKNGWGCIYCFKEPYLAEVHDLSVPGNWRESTQESQFFYWKYGREKIEDWELCTRLCFPHTAALNPEHHLVVYPQASAKIESVVREYEHQLERERQANEMEAIRQLFHQTISFEPTTPDGDKIDFFVRGRPDNQSAFDYRSFSSLSDFTRLLSSQWNGDASEFRLPFKGENWSIPIVEPLGVASRTQIDEAGFQNLYQVYTTLNECAVDEDIFIDAMQHAFRLAFFMCASPSSEQWPSVSQNLELAQTCFKEQHFEFELVATSGSFTRTIASVSGLYAALTALGRKRLEIEFCGDWSKFLLSPEYSISSFNEGAFARLFFTQLLPNQIFLCRAGLLVDKNQEESSERLGPHYALLAPPFQIQRFGLS